MKFTYDLTVVIPVHNAEKTLSESIRSILEQKVDANFKYEVLLINDGSTDDSEKLCMDIESKHDNFHYYSHENRGVSYTRNVGLDLSKGKYILFLDSDDALKEDTFKTVFDLFEEHYDKADILAYPLYNIKEGEIKQHPRFSIYKKSGVFNMTSNPQINQVTMNVVVKNLEDKVYFDESLFQSEDAFFNSHMIFKKGNIIISSEGGYYYRVGEFSTVQKYKNPAIIGNKILELFEKYIQDFSDENELNPYIQSSILYEINWRFKSNSLYPFHLKEEKWEEWNKRFDFILNNISDEIILKQNYMDFYHKMYFIERKKTNSIEVTSDSNYIYFKHNGKEISKQSKFTLVFEQMKFDNNHLNILGYIKFPFLDYLKGLELVIYRNGEVYKKIGEFKIASDSRYKTKQITNTFFLFEERLNIKEDVKFELKIHYNGFVYKTNSFMQDACVFKKKYTDLTYVLHSNKHISYKNKPFTLTVKGMSLDKMKYELINMKNSFERNYYKVYLFKKFNESKKKKNIWIYNDRINVFDNAYLQFKHDINMNDGIDRYYVTYPNEKIEGKFTKNELKYLVEYDSFQHKRLICHATIILTSFQNTFEYNPFKKRAYNYLNDMFNYKVVYLQHGVLHAHTPWIYSREKTKIDYFLTSSKYERELLTTKYNYKDENIIDLLMPRFSLDTAVTKSRKILFAPSWRITLTKGIKDLVWDLDEEAFLESRYFLETEKFLNSKGLMEFLEDNDLQIDFNLHPIFKGFKHHYKLDSSRIKVIDEVEDLASYKLFVTDFSSFVFDFINCGIPVLFFIPDEDEFLAGNHIYNELEIDLEKTFGKVTNTSKELLKHIDEIANNDFAILPRYKKSYEDFFNKVEHPMKEIHARLLDISITHLGKQNTPESEELSASTKNIY